MSSSHSLQDRRGRNFLSVRDQNTRDRLPQEAADDARAALPDPPLLGERGALRDADRGQRRSGGADEGPGIFSDVHTEVGQIIVAEVNKECVAGFVKPDRAALLDMIRKTPPVA